MNNNKVRSSGENPSGDFFLTTKEVCELLKWHPRTLLRKEKAGILVPDRTLRHKRYSYMAVQRLIREGCQSR